VTSVEIARSAAPDPPTGLKPLHDVLPDVCHKRSTVRGLGLVLRDLAIYSLAIWGLLSTDNPLVLIPLWIVAGLAVSGSFVLGHDAAHQALFDSAKLNAVVARVCMLPALHATEVWVFGHNRVHHGHTLRQGMDFVWHPLTVEEFEALGWVGRARHRFEWGPFGSGAYYLRHVWWNKMVLFPPPPRWRRRMRLDQALVLGIALAVLAILVAPSGTDGIWQWTKVVVIPFLVFTQIIGWVVYVHHIHPDIRWWPRREWNRFRGQVEGTTILWGPPGWDLIFHWIMVHVPHHVDMAIPCYRLPRAAKEMAAAYPDYVDERPISVRDYVATTRVCKLYDFEAGHWLPYPERDRMSRAEESSPGGESNS
jgi:omega-6 fatty acid desaturase (delta-12 desaturase)